MEYLKIRNLFEKSLNPEFVSSDTTVKDTIEIMKKKDFSQLPVFEDKVCIGVVSWKSIGRNISNSSLDLPVKHFLDTDVRYVSLEDDLYDVLDVIKANEFVLIGNRSRIDGIITYSDVIDFLQKFSKGFLIINSIEETLRKLIESKMKDENITKVLENTFSSIKEDFESREFKIPKGLGELSFDQYKTMIIHPDNWEKFEDIFDERELVKRRLEKVRDIRNEIAHFRKSPHKIEKYEIEELNEVRKWLERLAS